MDLDKELDLDLDEIMQEFSGIEPAPKEPVPSDTIRLDQIREAVAAAAPAPRSETAVFAPVRIEEEPEEEELPPPAPEVEPFSEEWEPEYDAPMGDYPTPEPIRFRPRARLKELREKLVAGPEKRYYELLELGLGKLQLALLLCLGVFAVSAVFTGMYGFGMIGPDRMRLLVFVQFLGLLLSALLGCYQLMDGATDLIRLRFTPNTLLLVTFIVCCIDGVLCLQELRVPVSAAFSLEMAMALWGTYDRRSAQLGMMDTMRRATALDAIAKVDDWYDGRPGYCTGKGEVEHFMDHVDAPSGPEQVLDWYALAALGVSLVIAILAWVRHGSSTGIQLFSAALLVSLPATAFLSVTRPLAILEKRLHKLGTVLCGWQGVKAAERRSAFPLEDTDLFPHGSAKLNGMKFYGDWDPDDVVTYATALIRQGGGTLSSLFGKLLESRGGYACSVNALHVYKGGIGGEIGDIGVLVGTPTLMQEMGVDLGSGTRVEQAIYCAIEGELAGVFAITYGRSRSSAAGLRTLCGSRGMTPVVLSEDLMVTESFIRSRFNINTRRMAFPGREQRLELSMKAPQEDDPVIALTTKEGLSPKAFAITGAQALKSALRTGVAIHMAGGILGLGIMAAIAWIGGGNILTPENILLYELIWMLPGLLVTEWTRTI